MSGDKESVPEVEAEEESDKNYKPPPQKTIDEMLAQDENDESLKKYKEALLGGAKTGSVIIDPSDPRKVIVRKLVMECTDGPHKELDLCGDLSKLKKQTFVIKEGIQYRIRIDFHVQREIVHGLKYIQKISRKGIQVEKMTHMVGSYAPKSEVQSYTTPPEDAPSGLLARGTYQVKSNFTDDDGNEHLKWEWAFEIKSDWK
ncbi:unnamed protein product [Darwinula stevensoni]|uniref:Rho GDP-dissociation inhibitor 3 n=1 Tax=Darwinula stevensoni TaxID=69355 RepID=A0A7R9AAY7_9CRUS|nr:unnamed protein product [Darwinula stevensoni]CAG0898796.1 unnamed protein product [Darwinula stevensoni]